LSIRPISVNEAASRLGLSTITVRRLIKRGQLPHLPPVGRAIRVPEDAVDKILARLQPPASTAGRRTT